MPIPRGFVEVHPLEQPPFIKSELLKHGAIVKYLRTRETTGTDELTEFQMVSGFLSRTGAGQVVHEFVSRGGLGLPFKVLGEPALNARLCAIKERWVIWLQWVSAWAWDVGAAYDLMKLRELQGRMRETDDQLDRAILEAGGAFLGGSAMLGVEDVTASEHGAPLSERARRRAEKLKAPHEQQRARALIRRLLAIGAPPLATVRREFAAAGFTLEQLEQAAEEVAAEVVITRKDSARKLRLPTKGHAPAKVIAKSPNMVRKQIEADIAEEEALERAASRRALGAAEVDEAWSLEELSRKRQAEQSPATGWLREQLAKGPRRLREVRAEMPAPDSSDQIARDSLFVTLAREAHVLVRRRGKRGFYIELASEDLEPDESFVDAVRAAMEREGSPHIGYPTPRAWY